MPLEPSKGQVQYGRRLLLPLIEERARNRHPRPYASIPVSNDIHDGFRDITYALFANAINRCAHWLLSHVERCLPSSDNINLVYFGPNDLRYQILSQAAVKSGHVMFFPSPRNSTEAFGALFEEASVSIVISDTTHAPLVARLQEHRQLRHLVVSDLNHLLGEDLVDNIPFDGDFDSYRFKPLVLLHTSGSTGLPKIVTIRHGFVSVTDAYHLLPVNESMVRYGHSRVFIPFPPFHIAGFNYSLPVICWVDSTVILPPASPINADLVNSVHLKSSAEYSMLAPAIINDLSKNAEYLQNLRQLKGLTFAGGPLSNETAQLVSQQTSLTSSMGATEYGGIPMLPKDPEDWAYFRFNEEVGDLEFRETDQPGLFEMVFVKEKNVDLLQAIFVTFPELQEYHTKDCFTKHLTKPGFWKYEARLDDIILFSNGEKINPVTMEGIITSCPNVKGCLVVGQGMFQSTVIVEPKDQHLSVEDLKAEVLPYIRRANESIGNYGRIAPECVIFTDPKKPLARAAKGTVQRSQNNKRYHLEIEQLYQNLDRMTATSQKADIDLRTIQSTQESLMSYFRQNLEIDELDLDDDFFALGMDSLQLISTVKALNLASGKSVFDQKQVYENPTVRKLAALVHNGPATYDYDDFDDYTDLEKTTWISMEDTFNNLSLTLPQETSRQFNLKNILKSTASPPLFQPDGGVTAWLQVLGSLLINVNNWGLVNSFGVYQDYYQTSYLADYPVSSIAWIGTIQGALLLLVGVISGPLFDKGYYRVILVVASVGVVFGLMMLSLATTYYQIMLSQGVLVGFCLGLLYIPSVAIIPLYFKRHRGLALGIATAGGSLGGVIYPIVFRRILQQLGFGWANRIIGFIALVTLITANIIIRPLASRATRNLVDLSAFRDVPYASFTVAGFLLFAGVLVPFFLAPTYASQHLSASSDLSFYTLSILNAAQFFGRIIPAILSDYIGPEVLLLGAEVAAGILAFAWIAVSSTAGFIVWLLFFGFISGMVVTLPAAVLPWISPSLAVIGTRLGMLYAIAGIGFLISTPVATAADQSTGGYLGAQIWIGACCFVAAGFYLITCREANKMRRTYESRKKIQR
ncbi:Non-canonical non-ribosomal peptide synthetase FUB8 [Lachnellula suecica]|uniref:Non-canonical non-ribosomal peptide synthetase FUB8 n=1 Tax=Lachnellula suecica TaxID=602035 RepID=A0A8T9C3C8_9HELO|nr:Non-canonical non-ribosomal peptide synthetase FUB8 [Lachnellula suecica]